MKNQADTMQALVLVENNNIQLQQVERPQHAEPGHLIVKIITCGINAGDNAFIGGVFPKGTIAVSQHDIAGVSGVGRIEKIGAEVPASYLGRNVAIYRSLKFDDALVGTWCETAHVHLQHCVVLPDTVNPEAYSGSLVNIITPLAFIKQIIEEGHNGIITTAGNSATGLAMAGIAKAYGMPLIAIVRNDESSKELAQLGVENILVQSDPNFKSRLQEISRELKTTAVFDGVGAAMLESITDLLPYGSSFYSYGYLGGFSPFSLNLGILMRKNLTIKSFGNFSSKTVRTPELLSEALNEISGFIDQPFFITKIGQRFSFAEINAALAYKDADGGKAVIYPGS